MPQSRLAPTPLRDRRAACRVGPPPRGPARALSWHRFHALRAYAGALLRARLRGPIGGAEHGRLLRQLFESLGSTWTKLGQLLGMRRDVFSGEFCREMSKVQDRAQGFPGDLAMQILEADLGPSFRLAFSELDETPFAAASIGQVHLGRLRATGERVAVKIRRPFVVEQMAHDLRWLARASRLLTRLRIKPSFAWDDLVWELTTALREEVDYRLEAAYLARMKKSLSAHEIHVPTVFTDLTTERVLVMEYLDGVFMSEVIAMEQEDPARLEAWLRENNNSREAIGRKLNHSMNRQIFEDNFFHSDLHPGNILLLRDNGIALIDFGAAGSLEREFLQKYTLYYQAIVNRQYDRAVDLLLLLAPQSAANANTDEFRKRYLATMKQFETRTATRALGYHERSIVSVFGDIMRDLAALEIPLDWSFMRADRAQLTLDASLMYLLPDVDYLQLVGEYWQEAHARLALDSAESVSAPRRWPLDMVPRLLEGIEEAEQIGIELLRAHSTASRRVFGALVRGAVAVVAAASNAFALLFAAAASIYLFPAAAAVTRPRRSRRIAWLETPIVLRAVAIVLIVLAGLRWEARRVKAKMLA